MCRPATAIPWFSSGEKEGWGQPVKGPVVRVHSPGSHTGNCEPAQQPTLTAVGSVSSTIQHIKLPKKGFLSYKFTMLELALAHHDLAEAR